MPQKPRLRELLQPGDLRTVANVPAAVQAVLQNPKLTRSLVKCLFDKDAGVRMRSADALEKISRQRADDLQEFAGVLLSLFEEAEQQELQWHLAVVLPRLRLLPRERHRAVQVLQRCMASRSSIVKTCALQALSDLSLQDESLLPLAYGLLTEAEATGTPAMRARSRKLLRALSKRVHSQESSL